MVLAGNLDHVLEMAQDIVRGRLLAIAQEGHEVNADDAALPGAGADLGVRAIARVIVERRAAGMREGDGLLRVLERVGRSLAATVAQIDQNADFVHAFDGLHASEAQAGIRGFEAAVAQEISAVIGWLDNTQAQSMQLVEPGKIRLESDAVLESVKESELSALLGRNDVRCRAYPRERLGMRIDLAFHLADVDHR